MTGPRDRLRVHRGQVDQAADAGSVTDEAKPIAAGPFGVETVPGQPRQGTSQHRGQVRAGRDWSALDRGAVNARYGQPVGATQAPRLPC